MAFELVFSIKLHELNGHNMFLCKVFIQNTHIFTEFPSQWILVFWLPSSHTPPCHDIRAFWRCLSLALNVVYRVADYGKSVFRIVAHQSGNRTTLCEVTDCALRAIAASDAYQFGCLSLNALGRIGAENAYEGENDMNSFAIRHT